MNLKSIKKLRFCLLSVTGALLATELLVRAAGMIDFPLYDANAQIGYILAASQQWSFLNKNTWQFNALHMGAPAFKPVAGLNVLLVGDSLVYGGNSLRQQVLYPDLAELADPALEASHFAAGQGLLAQMSARQVQRVASSPRWTSQLYRDGIHPTPEGNAVLADLLSTY